MQALRIASLVVAVAAYSGVFFLVHLCTMQPNQLQWSIWVTGAIAVLLGLGGFLAAFGLFGVGAGRRSAAA